MVYEESHLRLIFIFLETMFSSQMEMLREKINPLGQLCNAFFFIVEKHVILGVFSLSGLNVTSLVRCV